MMAFPPGLSVRAISLITLALVIISGGGGGLCSEQDRDTTEKQIDGVKAVATLVNVARAARHRLFKSRRCWQQFCRNSTDVLCIQSIGWANVIRGAHAEGPLVANSKFAVSGVLLYGLNLCPKKNGKHRLRRTIQKQRVRATRAGQVAARAPRHVCVSSTGTSCTPPVPKSTMYLPARPSAW